MRQFGCRWFVYCCAKRAFALRFELTGREAPEAFRKEGVNAVEKGVFLMNEFWKENFLTPPRFAEKTYVIW
jgi:hypothetical protein